MGRHKKLSGSREVADLACETSSSGLSRKDPPPQGPPTTVSCSGSSSEGRISAAYDTLLMNSVQDVPQIPPPHWFVAYYRNGRGNFIHAFWYLAKEIGTIPEGNLKKYGSREVADLAYETSSSGLSMEDSPPQRPPTAVFCSGSSSEGRISAAYPWQEGILKQPEAVKNQLVGAEKSRQEWGRWTNPT
ncbi:hypothetical protein E2C01_039464 [Portunus trituberculatus]|uniref:Uncharacterized protein n=1 Tax=Portunus trituberculatus TaxID=210409 RepID=A0A5B7FJR4_PORTR|nr:hypothetical protein [Portunus trituberculatus]